MSSYELRQEEGCFVIVVPPRADGLSRLLGLHPTCARLVVWSILPAGGNHTSGGSLTAWLLALLLRSRRSEHLRVALSNALTLTLTANVRPFTQTGAEG